ncbi:FG-GAP-like repeat-containing protein [Calditrichota bacterium]
MNVVERTTFFVCLSMLFLPAVLFAQIDWTEHTIAGNFDGATGVYAIDLDGDGDLDVLGASQISDDVFWWENDGEEDFTEHEINDNYTDAKPIFAIDVDGDEDIDVLSGGQTGNIISWWENDGDEDFDQHDLSTTFDGCRGVHAADVDSDGDIDILGAARALNVVYWWENEGDGDFAQRSISDFSDGAGCVWGADMDGDEDVDVVVAAADSNRISWFENDGDEVFTEHIITSTAQGLAMCGAFDLDQDGDMDVLACANRDSTIAWWENDGEMNFVMHEIVDDFVSARYADPVDIDNDGDLDILGCARDVDAVRWYENDGEMNFTEYVISEDFTWSITVVGGDVDGDGDMDAIVADYQDDDITWFESNLAPETSLEEPEDEAVFEELPVTLSWSTQEVPQPGGDLSYEVQWSTDEDFEEYESAETGAETSLELNDLENYTQYWWRVQTSDANTGIVLMSQETWSFEIFIPQTPGNFTLLVPTNDTLFTLPDVALFWSSAFDPDPGDEVVYDVYLSTDRQNLDDPVETGLTDTTVTLELYNQVTYFWTVHARDNNTAGTWADDTLSFTIELQDPPSHFTLLQPENGTILTPDNSREVTMTWQNSTDPDSGEDVTYELILMAVLSGDTLDNVQLRDLADTNFTIDLPAEFELVDWADSVRIQWRVNAVSGRYSIECDERFTIIIEPAISSAPSPAPALPAKFAITSLYPNPFNSTLSITVALPVESNLHLSIYNIIGQQTAILANGTYSPGFKKLTFEAINYPSGIYFIHATMPGKFEEVKKVVITK